jgi:hypothetical protein
MMIKVAIQTLWNYAQKFAEQIFASGTHMLIHQTKE